MKKIGKLILLLFFAEMVTLFSAGWSSDYTPQQAEYLCREVMNTNSEALSPGNPSAFRIKHVKYEGGKYKFVVQFSCCAADGRNWNRCAPVTLGEDSNGFYIKTYVNRTDSTPSKLRLKSAPLKTF